MQLALGSLGTFSALFKLAEVPSLDLEGFPMIFCGLIQSHMNGASLAGEVIERQAAAF
jgi:hypothetical protein